MRGPYLFGVGLHVLSATGNRRIVDMDSTLRAAAEYILGLGCMYGLFAASEDVVRCRCRFDAYILLPIIIATYYYVRFFIQNSLCTKIPKARGPVYDKLSRKVPERTRQPADT